MSELTKGRLYVIGIDVVTKFLSFNKLPDITSYVNVDIPSRVPNKYLQLMIVNKICGFYRKESSSIYISINRCAYPTTDNSGRLYSFPRNKVDRTPLGVLCHEAGHHIDAHLDFPSSMISGFIPFRVPRVSSYEGNDSELFAESIRLFILNPDLLRLGCPDRYKFITSRLSLKPIET